MIDPKCYEEHKDECFGVQPIDTLELLSMTRPADAQGYYHCYGMENFTTNTTHKWPEDVDKDVKETLDNEKKENKVLSAPCTAVKFIPRVLLTKTQDEPSTDTTINTNIVSYTDKATNTSDET